MNIRYKPLLAETEQPIIIIGATGIVKDAHLPAYEMAGYAVFGITASIYDVLATMKVVTCYISNKAEEFY
jgi:hypothetical protein